MGTGYAKFGNIEYTAGWSLDYQLGQSPSVCSIITVPHTNYLQSQGDLILGETGRGELVIRDCLLTTPTLSADRKWTLPILDRRWRWEFGEISGVYNIKRPDKTFIREKTPQELAALLLEAMGEVRNRWDISQLPNLSRPPIEWENENPASAFDDLVTGLGCVWTLDYFSDRVVVWQIGKGVDLPEAPTIQRSLGFHAVARPDSIKCYGGKTIYQARFRTEAVAEDIDGKIRPLNKLNPDNKPNGYKVVDSDEPEEFDEIDSELKYDDNGEEKKTRDLARGSAYRWYRITGLADSDGNAINWSPEELKKTDLEPKTFFDLEIIDGKAEQYVDENDIGPDGKPSGRKQNKRPEVIGIWCDSENDKIPSDPIRYKGGFSVDTKLGIIKFNDPVYMTYKEVAQQTDAEKRILSEYWQAAKFPNHGPATIYIDIAFYAGRDGLFERPWRLSELNTNNRPRTKPRIITRNEIERRVVQKYEQIGGKQKVVSTYRLPSYATGDTVDQIDKDLQYWIDSTLSEYETMPSYTRHYYGLQRLVPDGRIRQITWSAGDGDPPTTQVSLATEHNPYVPTPEDQRRKRTTDQLTKRRQLGAVRVSQSKAGVG